jgi:hypothetical protein
MRDGLATSVFFHAALLAWGLIAFHSPTPLDAGDIESIPIDFVRVEDATSAPKGVKTAAVAPKPQPDPVEKLIDKAPPEPKPAPPPPPPEPTPPPPEPTPPPPPEPTPPPPEPAPPAPPPEPAPPAPPEPAPPQPQAQAEPPPPAPPPPAPTPEPPPPPPEPAPKAPPPPPEPPPPQPAPQTAAIQPKPDKVPLPKQRPRVQPAVPAPQVAKKEPNKFDPDQITALLDKDKQPPAPQAQQPATAGVATASIDAKMTANELDALRARLAQCWSPPIGWTDPSEVRVILVISLNSDGTLNGAPKVVEQPQGRYAQPAAESALRAVRRCAPYALPPDKYEAWKQVRVTFDPKEMGGA